MKAKRVFFFSFFFCRCAFCFLHARCMRERTQRGRECFFSLCVWRGEERQSVEKFFSPFEKVEVFFFFALCLSSTLSLSLSLPLLFLSPTSQLLPTPDYFALSVSILGQGPPGLAIEHTAEKHGWLYTASSSIGGAAWPNRIVHSSVSKSGSIVSGRPKASEKKASVGRLQRLVQRPTQPDSWR